MFIIENTWSLVLQSPYCCVCYCYRVDDEITLVLHSQPIVVVVAVPPAGRPKLLTISERSPFANTFHRGNNMETEMPDLSHLTPEERRVIENVLMRQRQEEEQERIIVE